MLVRSRPPVINLVEEEEADSDVTQEEAQPPLSQENLSSFHAPFPESAFQLDLLPPRPSSAPSARSAPPHPPPARRVTAEDEVKAGLVRLCHRHPALGDAAVSFETLDLESLAAALLREDGMLVSVELVKRAALALRIGVAVLHRATK